MKKLIAIIMFFTVAAAVPAMAFNEDKFRATLVKLHRTLMAPPAAAAGNDNVKSGDKNPAQDDFVWLKAEKVNQQIEVMIRGIETAKGVATALAVIINLYNSDKISVDVALSAIQILKLRAVFLKVFITNGDTELEVMLHVLNEHEVQFSEMAKNAAANKTTVNVEAQGKIRNPVNAVP